jgi:sigma-B regulation protein RsbU (phosphoserine phosphatase)
MGLFALLGLLFILFICYAIYRGHRSRKLHAAHKELKADYGELETRTAEKERAQTEFRTALDAQEALLPAPLPKRKDLTVLASLTPGQALSSDLYDYLIRNERLIFCIGSAQGGTVQSSVQMAMAWSQFRTAAAISASPAQILSAINNTFAVTNGEEPTISLFVGVLNLTTGQLAYSQAGNFSPLLLQNEDVLQLPVETSLPVGASANTTYNALLTELAPGAMLFLYTNGVIDITNANGKTFGEKRLRGTALQALKMHIQPAPFLEGLKNTLREYTDSATPATDQTMLLISRN